MGIRNIEFRGKRIDNGEWVYGYLYITHSGEHEISSYDKKLNIERLTSVVVPESVGQYTGLTDKNGTKIFEGDIIKHYNDGINPQEFVLSIVKWDCLESRFYKMNIEDCTNWIMSASCKYEVIGNIHDNPELLKGGEG